jgi:hypothetical protein
LESAIENAMPVFVSERHFFFVGYGVYHGHSSDARLAGIFGDDMLLGNVHHSLTPTAVSASVVGVGAGAWNQVGSGIGFGGV